MKINYNMSAYVANSRLLQNEDLLTKSLERLSSGYKINHASDDPAGMAISSKMKSQIRGLDQANRNSSDGISVLETTEGALNEVNSILQRMRELAVQSGNDTYTQEDLQAMQDEIEALKEEIDRISEDTEFNKLHVLDGSMCARIYSNSRDITLAEASSEVRVGKYHFEVTADAQRAQYIGTHGTAFMYEGDTNPDIVSPEAGTISINGSKVTFTGKETAVERYEMLRNAAEIGEVVVFVGEYVANSDEYPSTNGFKPADNEYKNIDALYFFSAHTGSSETIEITSDNPRLLDAFGIGYDVKEKGKDVEVTADSNDFSGMATTITKGNMVTVTEMNGVSISFKVEDGAYFKNGGNLDVELNITDIGKMVFQVGANEHETIAISIPEVSTRTLFIDDLDVTTINGCDRALMALDNALAKVTSIRSSIGAVENRLNYTTENLDEVTLDMSSALSRIEDVDMATEMSTYTQMNVLVQAATSVLAQANDIPQQVLQLLQ